mgnify:CR=1 FL=1
MVKNGEKWWKMVNDFYGEWSFMIVKFTIFHHFSPFFQMNYLAFWFWFQHDIIILTQYMVIKWAFSVMEIQSIISKADSNLD